MDDFEVILPPEAFCLPPFLIKPWNKENCEEALTMLGAKRLALLGNGSDDAELEEIEGKIALLREMLKGFEIPAESSPNFSG